MKMKKHLIIYLASLVWLNACQPAPTAFNDDVENTGITYRLNRIDQIKPSGEVDVVNVFEYSTDGRIEAFMSPFPHAAFFYNEELLIDSIHFGNGKGDYAKIVWQERQPKERWHYRDGRLWCKTKFTFQGNQLVKAVRVISDPTGINMEHNFEYEYSGKNLKRIIQDGVVASEYQSYDSRPNIYRSFNMYWMLIAWDVDTMDFILSENNCTRLLYYGTYQYTFQYTFDSQGKPLERIVDANGSVEKYQFILEAL